MDLKVTMLAAALSFSAAIPASAASMFNLEATSLISEASGFSLVFEDLDGDMLFSLDELTDFSGISVFSTLVPNLAAVPTIADFTDGGIALSQTLPSYCGDYWCFDGAASGSPLENSTIGVPPERFQLEISVVPLPAGLPLLLTGLAGFAGLRMRKKRAAQV